LKAKGRGEFVALVLQGLPEAPQYFQHNAKMNREGPRAVNWEAPMPAEINSSADLTDPEKYYLVDIRNAKEYAEGHIPNSVNIAVRGRFENWVGTMVPWGSRLVLIGDSGLLKEALHRLHRVGYSGDIITLDSWKNAKHPVKTGNPISSQDLYALMQKGEAPLIVDVRLPAEWMALRIGTVLNLPLTHLAELSSKLDSEQPVTLVCNSAYRSSMATGILERKGFKIAKNLEGGSQAWIKAGLPVYKGQETSEAGLIPSKAVPMGSATDKTKDKTMNPSAKPNVPDKGC
jgi:hydroxyacylglutathione hydrolase